MQANPVGDLRARIPAWLWSGNPFYIASAACILIGLFRVLTPIYDNPDLAFEKFFSLVSLQAYSLMLLGVTLLILQWKNVVDDAVALTVLISFFVVGSAAGLDTVAAGAPGPTALFALAGTVLSAATLWGLHARVVGHFSKLSLTGVGLLLGWNLVTPVVLSRALDAGALDPALVGRWLTGWLTMLLAGVILVADAWRTPAGLPREVDADRPFLRTGAMRWIVVGLILLATVVHQCSLAWAFGLPVRQSDLLAGITLACALTLELFRAYRINGEIQDTAVALVPVLMAMIIIPSGDLSFTLFQPLPAGDGPASIAFWAQMVGPLNIACHPPAILLALAAYLAFAARHGKRPHLAYVGAIAALLGVLTFGVRPLFMKSGMTFELNLRAGVAAIILGLLVLAAIKRRYEPAVCAVIVAAVALGFSESVEALTHRLHTHLLFPSLLTIGLGFQVIAGLWRAHRLLGLARLGAVFLVIATLLFFFDRESPHFAPLAGCLALTLLLLPNLILLRDAALFLALLIPLSLAGYHHVHFNLGWCLVAMSFAMLAAGACASLMKSNDPPTSGEQGPVALPPLLTPPAPPAEPLPTGEKGDPVEPHGT